MHQQENKIEKMRQTTEQFKDYSYVFFCKEKSDLGQNDDDQVYKRE